MFLEKTAFLITVSHPIMHVCVDAISTRSVEHVRTALWRQVSFYSARGFIVRRLFTDGEGAIAALRTEIEGVVKIAVNLSGAGSHVPLVEVKIRQVKERVRGILNVLPHSLPHSLLSHLVYYCVAIINLVPTTVLEEYVSPREIVEGLRIDAKRDLGLEFGQYVEVHEQRQSTNGMEPRTRGAIALLPTGNRQGTWALLAFDTGGFINRDHWTTMPAGP